MGSFTTGIGLISGLNSASIIEQILMSEGRGRMRLQSRIAMLQGQQSAMLGINSKLLSLQSAAQSLGNEIILMEKDIIEDKEGRRRAFRESEDVGQMEWDALIRQLDRNGSDHRR